MKLSKSLNFLFLIILSLLVLAECRKDETTIINTITNTKSNPPTTVTIPASLTVNVPGSLNSPLKSKSLKGSDIYQALRGYVWVGETGAQLINGLCAILQTYTLTNTTTQTFKGADGVSKTLTMSSNVNANGTTWLYEMHVTDYDGTNALELYWNPNPVIAYAIFQAYKLNHTVSSRYQNAVVEIQYWEAQPNYSKQMIVSMDNLAIVNTNDPDNLEMFVGERTGDTLVDIYGNYNCPKAMLYNPNHTGGFQWVFVAHSNINIDISAAIICLPPCNYTKNDTTLWGSYSLLNVLDSDLIKGSARPDTIKSYLASAKSPGFFISGTGFSGCGMPPPQQLPKGFNPAFCNLKPLETYVFVPEAINTLNINLSKK